MTTLTLGFGDKGPTLAEVEAFCRLLRSKNAPGGTHFTLTMHSIGAYVDITAGRGSR